MHSLQANFNFKEFFIEVIVIIVLSKFAGFTLQTFSVLELFRSNHMWFINTYNRARKF